MKHLNEYHEIKPHRMKLLLWRIVNLCLFPLLPNGLRCLLLRLFGARVGKSLVYRSVKIYAPWNLTMGDYSCIGAHVEIYCKDKVSIGDDVVVSQGAFICTASHDTSSQLMELVTKPIVIGARAWICAKVIVLPGVTIGEGVVAAAGSVVVKDVVAWTIVGGNPARAIKKRIIEK